MSNNESGDSVDPNPEIDDLEKQLVVNVDELKAWIERLPADIKSALGENGGKLFPEQAAESFRFPQSLSSENQVVIEALGQGGRLWLLSRIFRLSWPYTGVLTKDIFELNGIGTVLQSDLARLQAPIGIRMIRFLLGCREFRQGMRALASHPDIAAEL